MAVERIMIVEDNNIVALDIRRQLERFGYEVFGVFPAGEDALVAAEKDLPDLVLMDIRLRGRMDGVETAEQFREVHDVPVVMLTAFADEATLDRAKISQPYAYVVKPFEEKELRTAVVNSLYRHQMEKLVRSQNERLRQSQKMEALGRLTGGIAHDFNNLLTVIMGYSRLIIDEISDDQTGPEEIIEDLQGIQNAALRSAALTRQLLSFSRNQSVERTHTDLNATVRHMEAILRQLLKEDVALTMDFTSETAVIFADPSQLEQVLMNLTVNARDAMPDGGRLILRTARRSLSLAEVIGRDDVSPGEFVVLTVTDTGSGMDRETLDRVFDPFFTTKQAGKGTGLGLSTVYGIVSQSGGFVDVESHLGEGTTFTVCFPAIDDAYGPTAAEGGVSHSDNGTETVLLVEDDEAIRTLLARILRAKGYRVLEASNAGEALLHSESEEGEVHLLVSDVVMPLMSGIKLAVRLREARPGIRVILMSGYPDTSVSPEEREALGLEFLRKPVEPQTLTATVRRILDG